MLEVEYDDQSILSVAAIDFIQYGEGGPAYDWGSLRYNSDIALTTVPQVGSVPLPATALLLGGAIAALCLRRRPRSARMTSSR